MDTSKLCMYCMEEHGGSDICPHCGKDANAPLIAGHLKPGEVIGGRFVVGRAVGQDASGVVYMVYDTMKGNKLRIREYLPRGIAARAEDGVTLTAMPGMAGQFDEGMAEMLARAESAEDPSRAMACFEENGTLYVVLRKKKAAAAAAVPAAQEEPAEPEDEETEEDEFDEDEEEEESEGLIGKLKQHMTAMLAGLIIVLVLIAAVIIIISRSSTDTTNTQNNNPSSPLDNWSAPTETPIPTAVPSDEFGNIVKPDQNWQNEAPGQNLNNWGEPQKTEVPDDYEPDWLTKPTEVPAVTDVPATDVPGETATAEPDESLEPEPTATPRPTLPAELIDRNSDDEIIAMLQARLMELGWLDIDEPTGQMGNLTKDAVKAFQGYIHDNFDDEMDVDGYAGKQTVEWLNREDAPRNPEVYPTPEPTEEPEPTETPEPTPEAGDPADPADPDAAETPEPTGIPADQVDPAITDEVQRRLIELGWMDESQHTGVYDNATMLALKDYQTYLNQVNPNAELPETGLADESTLLWLRWDGAPARPDVMPQATETPAPTETPVPEIIPYEVNAESPVEHIEWLQNKLVELQWLKMDQPTGVYDEFTTRAVTNVQMYLNQRHTLTLTTDGVCDSVTTSYLTSEYNAPVKPDSYAVVDATAAEEPQDPNQAPGTEGTVTPEPEETKIPEQPTEIPATNVPAPPQVTATDVPMATDAAEATEEPEETEVPATNEPTGTEAPATEVPAPPQATATDIPAATDAPEVTETPVPTQPVVIAIAYTNGNGINVRSEAAADSERVVQIAEAGTEVQIIDEVDVDGVIWYHIVYGEYAGYIRSDLLTLQADVTATPEPTPEVTATPEPTSEVTATPEPTSEVTATPEPTSEVTATPEPTPEVTATPEPTPEVTATPEPTPEVTATPEPTPEVTATPEPTPEVTATPEPTPEPTEDPESYVDKTSESERIKALQLRLIELKWLDAEEPTGSYDEATKLAVEAFQTYLNENWDEALYGKADEFMPEINREKADKKTLDLLSLPIAPVNPNAPVE